MGTGACKYGRAKKITALLCFAALLFCLIPAVLAGGAFAGHSPARGASVPSSSFQVSVYVKHTADLNAGSVAAWLDGNAVPAWFRYKGYWYEDYDSGELLYAVTSYKEGTIGFAAAGLADGPHTVEVSVLDAAGNALAECWSFSVAELPVISNLYPAHQGELKALERVAAAIADNSGVDWSSVTFKVNNSSVGFTVDQAAGTVTHYRDFSDGAYLASLEVKDTAGNRATRSWSFVVDSTPPALTSLQHFAGGMTITGGKLKFYARLNDLCDIKGNVALLLNGSPLPIELRYKGEWSYDGDEYFIHSYKEAYVSYEGPVEAGNHTLELYAEDKIGNSITRRWNFVAAEPPRIIGLYPADQDELKAVDRVCAVVQGPPGTVDWGSVVLKVNGTVVPHSVETATGTVCYSHAFADGSYRVDLEAANTAGERAQASWRFVRDASPPQVASLDFFTPGMNSSEGLLDFRARLTDLTGIKAGAALHLNGEPLAARFRYEGFYSYDGDYIVTSTGTAYVEYRGPVPNGSHSLSLYVEDKLGNGATYTWPFSVAAAPVVSAPSPAYYGVRDLRPVISAVLGARGGAIDPTSIVLELNGEVVPHDFDPATGLVSYLPQGPLADEEEYEVTLRAADVTGLIATRTWRFVTSTYPDMADAGVENCLPCHRAYPFAGSAGIYEDVHGRRLSFFGSHNNQSRWDCARCHDLVTVEAHCRQCHGDFLNHVPEYDQAPHGSTPDLRYSLRNVPAGYPFRVLENRGPFDCVLCHQPGVAIYKKAGGLLQNHDLPGLHRTEITGCSPCHASSLTREHAREGRRDGQGREVTCGTCHLSAEPAVVYAISAKDKSCSACHDFSATGTAHSELHEVNMEATCAGCHGSNMMAEAVYHRGDCNACHASADAVVRSAVLYRKDSCFDCHDRAHGLYMSTVREDIPLYAGAAWGTPQPAGLFSGEPWLPAVLEGEGARVVFSGRVEAESSQVYDFYRQAMAVSGWEPAGASSSQGSGGFSLLYRKGSRYCAVIYHAGPLLGAAGEGAGGRLIIAYH